MISLSTFHQAILFVVVYAAALVGASSLNRSSFRRSPEKGKRYEALPLRYKFACWLIVVPLFAGSILQPSLFLGAIVAFFLVEAACIRWYRRNGLLT